VFQNKRKEVVQYPSQTRIQLRSWSRSKRCSTKGMFVSKCFDKWRKCVYESVVWVL